MGIRPYRFILKDKDGEECIIRNAVPEDADELLIYLDAAAGESDFLTFGSGELNISVKEEKAFIKNFQDSDNQLFLIAVANNRIVGSLHFSTGKNKRVRHTGEMGVIVRKQFWGNGIAAAMIQQLFSWARASGVVRKINLEVREDNSRAISLYERLGFFQEGTVSRAFQVNGVFYSARLYGFITS